MITRVITLIAINLDDKLRSDVVYFDFAKAFDSVNHDIILSKLKYLYNIDGALLKFILNYLKDRNQNVVIGNHASSNKSVSSGVPQGSILGPLLFVLFINDLPQGLSDGTHLALYADDTKIWRSIQSHADHLYIQKDIDYLNSWASNNLMEFHPQKCKVLSVSHLPPPTVDNFIYTLNNVNLDYVEVEKDLGVDITPRLNWNSQCDRLCTKANQQLGIVKRNAYFVSDPMKRRALYISLVRSQFEHCSIVWRPTSKTNIQKIESIQKKAIKWIFSEEASSYGSLPTYLAKCKQVKLFTMADRFEINDILFLHKVINDYVPVDLPSYLSFSEGQSRLRSSHLDRLSLVSSRAPNVRVTSGNTTSDSDRASTNPFENSYFYRVHCKWNNLPLALREIESHSDFKIALMKYFWKNMVSEDDDWDDELFFDFN